MKDLERAIGKERVELECPNGHSIRVTLGEVRHSPVLHCGKCGATVEVDPSDLEREMKKVERSLRDLERTIKRFGR